MENNFWQKTKRFWKYMAVFYLLVILFFVLINMGFFGEMPSFKELEEPKNAVASQIYAADGSYLGKIFTHNRMPITYKDLPPHLVNALIATEDSRFYIHSGIDPKALLGVFKGVITADNRGGGSTITQQLAKNLFPRGKMNSILLIFRKLKEWLIAIKLERNFTKHEIIAGYFNTVEFSDNAFGVKSAAKTYFNKDVKQLTIPEAAVLVGMLKAPYKYNPRLHPQWSKDRRNVVLSKMLEFHFITPQQFDQFSKEDIKLDFRKDEEIEGLAPHFRGYLTNYLKKYFEEHPSKDGSIVNIYGDGLKIYTTIDPVLQRFAEEATEEHLKNYQAVLFNHWNGGNPWHGKDRRFMVHVRESKRYKSLKASGKMEEEIIQIMKTPVKMRVFSYSKGEKDTTMSPWDSIYYYQMFLQAGFMAVDPNTGFVKAWVGGANYKYFKYDHVNMNTKRQVGSVFKPFVYAVAIDQKGFSPCHQMPNERIVFRPGNPKWKLSAPWSPQNSGMRYGGSPTLKYALSQSLNTVTARLMYEVGPYAVIELLKNLGLDSNTKVPPYPSICLGTPEISVFEMVGAYTAFANEGIYTMPSFISRIEDKNGNILYEYYPKYKEVLRPEVAFVMQEMMKGVVDAGTAKRLRYAYGLTGEICGKTGTTQSNADGWFIGLTPDLIAGVWVGCEDRLVRFRTTGLGQGASMALPIWGKFFQKIAQSTKYKGLLDKKFVEPPKESRTIITDCSQYRGWGKESVDSKSLQPTFKDHGTEDLENKYGSIDEEETEEVAPVKASSKNSTNNSTKGATSKSTSTPSPQKKSTNQVKKTETEETW
jgi:penicillin-binding protein 1A